MEEFLNIDWHPPLEDMIDDVFINEARMKTESVTYRIMQGLFTDPFTDFESDDGEGEDEKEKVTDEKEKGTKEKTNYVPGILKPPFKFPRISNLNKEQHATCLRVLLRFSGREKPEMNSTNRSELELYTQLGPTIREEQEEFLKLAKTNWKGEQLKLIGEEYINERWKSRVKTVGKLPRYYAAGGNIPFNGEEKIIVTPEATLLELGKLPRVILPPCNKKRYLLHCNMNKLEMLYPASSDLILQKTTVSQDLNCERLADSGDIDLVVSSGGLNCLANNFGPNYTSSWILPIVVKDNGKRNIIYIDKPLPPTALTVPQKNTWIFKYILKSQLLHPNHLTSISLSEHDRQEVSDYGLFGNPHSDDLLKLEEEYDEFHSSDTNKKSNQFKLSGDSNPLKNQSTTNDAREVGDLKSSVPKDGFHSLETENCTQYSQEFSINPLEANKSHSEKEKSLQTEEVPMETCSSEEAMSVSKDKTYLDDEEDEEFDREVINDQTLETKTSIPAIYLPPGSNVVYKTFTLGPSEDISDDSTKTKVERYRLLVRTRIDGIERIDKETIQPVMLVPKLEHQVALGAEAVTAEEALKQWTTLTYRPETSLVRIRISAENSEVIQMERRTALSIENEIKRLYNLNVENTLVTLHNVVRDLKALKPGNYLLRHTPTNGAFATVYHEADSSGKNVFDLHAVYAQNSFQTIFNSPWPALDKGVLTPSQIHFERMPAMYHPPRYDLNIVSKVTRGRGRGRPRGTSRGGGRGAAQNTGRGAALNTGRGAARGGTRVRTKKAKKKNKEPETTAVGS